MLTIQLWPGRSLDRHATSLPQGPRVCRRMPGTMPLASPLHKWDRLVTSGKARLGQAPGPFSWRWRPSAQSQSIPNTGYPWCWHRWGLAASANLVIHGLQYLTAPRNSHYLFWSGSRDLLQLLTLLCLGVLCCYLLCSRFLLLFNALTGRENEHNPGL